jgi:hypothetical protein
VHNRFMGEWGKGRKSFNPNLSEGAENSPSVQTGVPFAAWREAFAVKAFQAAGRR